MADENKQLGTLQLNIGNVKTTIEEVNRMLASLGKGVDLDLTKIVNSKVSGELANLKKQIEEVHRAASGGSGGTNKNEDLKKTIALFKESYDAQIKLEKATSEGMRKYQLDRYNKATEGLKQYNAKLLEQARQIPQIQRLQTRLDEARIASSDKAAKARQQALEREAASAAKADEEAEARQKRLATTMISIAGAASLKVLKDQWTAAVNYATTYYDKLNEIRMVTMKTEDEATKIGQDMRDLAKEMKVTSTELSEAAVTFYRQGLDDAEVQDRLKWVTEYAKVANIKFDEAAQLMTASINTMGDSMEESGITNVVEHVADVFLYLGDNAATSGEEIGKAMQKASASATEFGLSFEWLGTYIATVSEQTRQAPESIGNAFNTMLARMHQIKASGFNDEDTTKLNDVAKALKNINVELLDSEGQWRDMDEIYTDIAKKWGELDAKTKGYLATTMAGTRQQNVFYALMNDLSKGIENGSRAWELYTGVMDAAGTATKKYAIYQESLAASQANMTASLEQLYSNLQPDLIKTFYDGLTFIVDGLNQMGGTLPVVISGIAGLTVGIVSLKSAMVAAHPLLAIFVGAITALAALVTQGVTGNLLDDWLGVETTEVQDTAKQYEEAANNVSKYQKNIQKLQEQRTQQNALSFKMSAGISLTNSELSEYNGLMQSLSGLSDAAKGAIDGFTTGQNDQVSSVKILNEEIERALANYASLIHQEKLSQLTNFTIPSDWDKRLMSNNTIENLADYLKQFGSLDQFEFLDTLQNIIAYWKNLWNDDGSIQNMFDGINLNSQFKMFVISMYQEMTGQQLFEAIDDSGKLPGNDMEMLASKIWAQLIGNSIANGEFENEMNAKADELVKLAVSASGESQNKFEEGFLYQYYMNVLVGKDGVLSESDFVGIGAQLSQKAAKYFYDGMQSISYGEDVLNYLADQILGDNPAEAFELKLKALFSSKSDDWTWINEFASWYNSFLEAGQDQVHISEIIENKIMSYFGGDLFKLAWEDFGLSDVPQSIRERVDKVSSTDKQQEIMKQISGLRSAGVEWENLDRILSANISEDNWIERLRQANEELKTTSENAEDAGYSIKTNMFNNVKSSTDLLEDFAKEIDAIDKLKKTAQSGEPLTWDDIVDVAKAHPEILAVINDTEILIETLNHLKASATTDARQKLKEFLLTDEAFFASTAYAKEDIVAEKGIKTQEAYSKFISFSANYDDTWIDSQVDGILKFADATNEASEAVKLLDTQFQESFLANASQEGIASYIKNFFGGGNVDWTKRKRISAEEMRAYGWNISATKLGYGTATTVGEKTFEIRVTPIMPDGQVLSERSLWAYVDEISEKAAKMGMTLFEADAVENGGKGLLYYVQEVTGSLDDAVAAADEFDIALSRALAEYDSRSVNELAKSIAEEFETAKASANGFKVVLDNMNVRDAKNIMAYFQSLSDGVQSGFVDEYKELSVAMLNYKQAVMEYESIAARAVKTKAEDRRKTLDLMAAEEKIARAEAELYNELDEAENQRVQKEIETEIKNSKDLSALFADVSKIQSLKEKLEEGNPLTTKELFDLAEANPDIMEVADNVEQLKEKLDELQNADEKAIKEKLLNIFKISAEAFDISPYAESYKQQGISNFAQLESYFGSEAYKSQFEDGEAVSKDALTNLSAYLEIVVQGFIDFANAADDAAESVENVNNAASVSTALTQIDKINSVLNSIEQEGTFSLDDVLDLAQTNEKLLAVVGNVEDLEKALSEMKMDLKNGTITSLLTEMFMNNETIASAFPFANLQKTTLNAYKDTLKDTGEEGEQAIAQIDGWVKSLIADVLSLIDAAEQVKDELTGIDLVASNMQKADAMESALEALTNTENYDQTKALEAMITLRDTLQELKGEEYSLGEMPNAVEDPEGFATWLAEAKVQAAALIEEIQATAHAYGILTEEEIESAKAAEEARKAREDYIKSMKDLSQSIADEIEANKASSNGYAAQIAALQTALNEGNIQDAANTWKGFNDTIKSGLQKTYPRLVKVLADIATEEGDVEQHAQSLATELKNAEEVASAKYFKDSAKALHDYEAGLISTDEALTTFKEEEAQASKALQEYNNMVKAAEEGTEITEDSVSNLAKALDWDPKAVIDPKNLERVGELMQDMDKAAADLRKEFQKEIYLSLIGTSSADFSDIESGLLSVDNMSKQVVDDLIATGQFEVVRKWMEEGMEYKTFDPEGNIITTKAQSAGFVDVIVPKGGGIPTKSDNTSKGGGGGGGGKQETTTGSSRVLDMMDKVHTLETNNRNLYAQQAEYYKKTGDDANYAEARTKEIEALNDINNSLRVNIEELEKWIDLKKEELNTLDESSDKYTEVAEELEALQERHYEYTTELLSNESELFDQIVAALEEQDNKAQSMLEGTIEVQQAILDVMKEQKSKQDSMLQGRVNVEKLILSTLEQQEALVDSMMNGRIKMENTILNIIKAQINAERQLLSAVVAVENKISSIIQAQASMQKSMMQGRVNMENTIAGIIKSNLQKQKEDALAAANAANEANQKQIEALEKQKELLDEQLKLRKEAAKEQDKQAKLAELESQYARISADPTRMKEALKIKQQIDDLRDEIAWDIAQKEVDAQKKVIDEEIERLREIDYTAGVAEMYDAMINDTEAIMKKVEEMLDTMTDNEIIEWLKENDADYAVSSKTSQKLQVMEWRDMLDEMHGIQKDYTEEVAQIMELSSDEIFEWLQKNDDEYKRASDASKKVMEAEWREMLANMEGTTENYVERVASILQQPRDEILEWLKRNDEEYAQASDTRREKMVKDWNTALDEMYGTTKTRWDEINAIMSQGLDGFLEYMEEYNTEYADMSEAEKERTALGWAETWREMTGEVEDHNAEMEAVIAQGHDAYIEYLKANSETYKTATAATQQSMLQTWEDSWDKMNGVTNKYEDEAHSIIAQGQEAIIATLTGYTDDYRKIGEAQSSEYVGAWSEQIEALMSQLASLSGAVQSMGGTVDTALADAAEKIENFQYSLVLSPEGKNETNADLANDTISTILKAVEEINLVPTKKYASGGLIDYTGPAWMDGTSYQPERVLSPYQTELFEILVRSMEQMSKIAVPSFPSFGGFAGGAGGGLTFGDIIVNVEKLDSETDYDDMAERVLDSVMGKINRSSVVGGIRYSR